MRITPCPPALPPADLPPRPSAVAAARGAAWHVARLYLVPEAPPDPEADRELHIALHRAAAVAGRARRAFVGAVWALAVGSDVADATSRDVGPVSHATGTYLARALGDVSPTGLRIAYRARAAVVAAIGAELVWSRAPIAATSRFRSLLCPLSPRQRRGLADWALDAWRRGELPEPDVRPEIDPVPAIPLGLASGWTGRRVIRCPYHDDRSPSLSIRVDAPGQGCGRCHAAGCGVRIAIRSRGDDLVGYAARDCAPSRQDEGEPRSRRIGPRNPAYGPGETSNDPSADPVVHFRPGIAPSWRPQRVAVEVTEGPEGRRVRETRAGQGPLAVLGLHDRASERAAGEAAVWRSQRYETVGFRSAGAGDLVVRRDGAAFARRWSHAAGTDRVIVDLDGLDLTELGLPDVRLRSVLDAARARAARDPRVARDRLVELVETGPDGVQLRIPLREAWTAAEEIRAYRSPEIRAWLAAWGEWLRGAVGRGGRVDPAVWAPNRLCRAPGWRWSSRLGVVWRAAHVDELERERAARSEIAINIRRRKLVNEDPVLKVA